MIMLWEIIRNSVEVSMVIIFLIPILTCFTVDMQKMCVSSLNDHIRVSWTVKGRGWKRKGAHGLVLPLNMGSKFHPSKENFLWGRTAVPTVLYVLL